MYQRFPYVCACVCMYVCIYTGGAWLHGFIHLIDCLASSYQTRVVTDRDAAAAQYCAQGRTEPRIRHGAPSVSPHGR